MTHIRDLKPDPKNSRRHNPRNVGIVENSIQREGFGRSILIANDGTIIAGNATAEAAASAGLENMIVVESDGTKVIAVKRVDVEPGTDRFHKLAIADNRAAELADWDPAILQALAADIDLAQFFRDDELDALLASLNEPIVGLTDPDDVPPVPDEPVTKPGDLWLLGRHRLLCGDATVVTDVERLMDGAKADMVFTDPPYEIETRGGGILRTSAAMRGIRELGIDTFSPSTLIPLAPTSVFCCNKPLIPEYIDLARSWGVSWDLCIYHKQNAAPNYGGHMMTDLEYLFVIGAQSPIPGQDKELYSKLYSGGKDQDNEIAWSKPTELCSKFMRLYSTGNGLIADVFGGTGSTLIACEQTGRRCAMMEISPSYTDVIVKRWENFTGGTAVLAHDHAMVAD